MTSVNRYRNYRASIGAPVDLTDGGIIIGSLRDTVMTRDSRRAIAEFERAYPSLVLKPMIPERVIVREARAAGEYYGWYPAGKPVHAAYMTITERITAP